jgi:DNA-binding beta-propeller fold protein YncE
VSATGGPDARRERMSTRREPANHAAQTVNIRGRLVAGFRTWLGGRSLVAAVAAAAALAFAAGLAVAQGTSSGRIGPALRITDNGRHLTPFGHLVALGNFPTGGAVTPDGRFYWAVDTGRGIDDVRIVSVASRRVIQVLRVPGASGGVAIDPRHPLVYVSGIPDSTYKENKSPPGTPGTAGDVIHVFRYDPAGGRATFDHLIPVPPPAGVPLPQAYDLGLPPLGPPQPQTFPPTNVGQKQSWPDRLAVSPDGARLLVPLNLADDAAVVDVASRQVRYVATGNYPYGAAISRDGKLGFVSNETPGTVSVVDLAAAKKVKDIQVGAHLSHPEGLVADPVADRVYVAVANSDQVAAIDTGSLQVTRTLYAGRHEGLGTSPVALAVTPDGRELLAAEAGADEISVFSLPHQGSRTPAWAPVGRIPTAQYPTDVQVTRATVACDAQARRRARPRRRRRRRHAHRAPAFTARHRVRRRRTPPRLCPKLLYIGGKGLGAGPNPAGPQPNQPSDSDDRINETQYLPLLNIGDAGIGDYPSDARIAADAALADAQVRPSNPASPPSGTPLRAGGPIKHVFYIVRENRTYDQVLGDDPRGDGDPKLTLFGARVTPNAHALADRFPLLDGFYGDSEASIDGHFWTSAGYTSDYVNKNWFENYAGRDRPYDFGVYAVTWPGNGFLFDQAQRQGISYFNYGEAIAGTVPLTDKDRTPAENQQVVTKFAHSDLGSSAGVNTPAGACYPNDAYVGQDSITGRTVFDSTPPAGAPLGSESRYECFAARFRSQLATGTVPTFNYVVLSNDHTRVLDPGAYTPTAMVADNDYALGQMVDLITHSPIWSSSAIFVTEDDSQDGADHVDAHRTVGLVISPYAKQAAVVHTRYDMLSMIRSMELIMGMRPLYLTDALATPMYDAFTPTAANPTPFTAIGPKVSLLSTNPQATSAAQARALRFRGLDQISQRAEDRLLWRSVHGPDSPPPPPGPNAVVEPAAGRANPDG